MSNLKSLAIVVAAAAVVAAGPGSAVVANAQQKIVEITPFAGYYIASDIYNSYGSVQYGHVGLANSFMWGGRLTASNPRGGIEFAYTRTGSDVSINPPLVGQPSSNVGRLDIDNYDINFLAYQPSGNPRVGGDPSQHQFEFRRGKGPGGLHALQLQLRPGREGGDESQTRHEARGSLARHGHQLPDQRRLLVRPVGLLLLVRHELVQQRRAGRRAELHPSLARGTPGARRVRNAAGVRVSLKRGGAG